MKTNILYCIAIWIMLIIIPSCKKDKSLETDMIPKISNDSISPAGNDSSNTHNLIFGSNDSSNSVHSYNPNIIVVASANGGTVTDSVDIPGTNGYDILLYSYGQHWANTKTSSLSSLNSCTEFLTNIIHDSIFLTVSNLNTTVNADTVSYNSYSGFNSGNSNDSLIQAFTDYYPVQFNYNDTVNTNDASNIWSTSAILSASMNGYHYAEPNVFKYLRKGTWSEAGIKYLCFRNNCNGSYKYGWLKLRVDYNSSITVLESSIQN